MYLRVCGSWETNHWKGLILSFFFLIQNSWLTCTFEIKWNWVWHFPCFFAFREVEYDRPSFLFLEKKFFIYNVTHRCERSACVVTSCGGHIFVSTIISCTPFCSHFLWVHVINIQVSAIPTKISLYGLGNPLQGYSCQQTRTNFSRFGNLLYKVGDYV